MSMSSTEHVVNTAGELLLFGFHDYLMSHNIKVRDLPTRGPTARPSAGQSCPLPPWDWLILAFATAADLLAASYPVPLRDMLTTILNKVPQGGSEAMALERARRLLKVKWTELLELDCRTVAELLRELVKHLRMEARREETEGRQEQQTSETEEDPGYRRYDEVMGQCCKLSPKPFEYAGVQYSFGVKQSRLLYYLTHDDDDHERYDEDRAVSDSSLVWLVWQRDAPAGQPIPSGNRLLKCLENLQLKTNAALKRKGIPLKIIRPSHKHLQLV